MNCITLTFKAKQLEQEFRDYKTRTFQMLTLYQQWIALLINIVSLVSCLISKDWIITALSITSIVFIMLSIKLNDKYPIIYELIIIVYILFIHAYSSLGEYFQYIAIDLTYVEGFFVGLACLSLLNILNFFERALIIVLLLLMYLIFGIEYSENNLIIYFKIGLCTVVYLQYTYSSEKVLKKEYLEQRKNQQFLQKFAKFNDVQSFAMKYDERKSLVLIEKNNNKRVRKEDQEYFNQLIQLMQLSTKNSKSRISEIFNSQNGISPHRQTLKQVLLGVAKEQNNDSNADTPLKNKNEMYLYGFFEQQAFTLCIFQVYDLNPVTMLLMKESRSESQEEELKLRNKNLQKQFDHLKQVFDSQIRQSLIYFRWIYQYANKQSQIRLINRLLKSIHYLLLKSYTDYLNLESFNHLNTQQLCLSSFNLITLIQDSINICEGYLRNSVASITNLVDFEIKNYLDQTILLSDYQRIQLLFINLLFFTSKFSQSVVIELEQISIPELDAPIIKIKIFYQFPNKTKHQIQNLPILNPQSLSELKHNSTVPLELEIPISIMLIRRLGPFDKMKIVQNKKSSNYLEFYLFRELQADSMLIPIISMKPAEKITTHHTSSIVQTFNSTYHYDSAHESILYL